MDKKVKLKNWLEDLYVRQLKFIESLKSDKALKTGDVDFFKRRFREVEDLVSEVDDLSKEFEGQINTIRTFIKSRLRNHAKSPTKETGSLKGVNNKRTTGKSKYRKTDDKSIIKRRSKKYTSSTQGHGVWTQFNVHGARRIDGDKTGIKRTKGE